MMTLDEFATITSTRIPTPLEFLEFADGQNWTITETGENRAALRVTDRTDPMAQALAKMLSREPYRTEVLKLVRDRRQTTEPTQCKHCQRIWLCTRDEIHTLAQNPHWCSMGPCPYRLTPARNEQSSPGS
jgi:hypothetical protein